MTTDKENKEDLENVFDKEVKEDNFISIVEKLISQGWFLFNKKDKDPDASHEFVMVRIPNYTKKKTYLKDEFVCLNPFICFHPFNYEHYLCFAREKSMRLASSDNTENRLKSLYGCNNFKMDS